MPWHQATRLRPCRLPLCERQRNEARTNHGLEPFPKGQPVEHGRDRAIFENEFSKSEVARFDDLILVRAPRKEHREVGLLGVGPALVIFRGRGQQFGDASCAAIRPRRFVFILFRHVTDRAPDAPRCRICLPGLTPYNASQVAFTR